MADTKDFDVIRVARSDGSDTGPGYWPVAQTSTISAAKKSIKDIAAEKAPRTKPQMTRLSEDDPRYVEWRVKLGILLKQELSPTPDEGNAWYVQFPRGYWLYEKSKHLWVSGYPIKAKLFKSPQEFALHLIWLLSASKEYRDCCCVHCNSALAAKLASDADETLVIKPFETSQKTEKAPAKIEKTTTKTEKIPPKVTPVPLPPIPGQPMAKQPAPAPAPAAPQAKQQPAPPKALTPKPTTPTPPKSNTPKTVSPVPPPPIPGAAARASQEPPASSRPQPQPVNWSLQSPLLFRSGELVWYQNGSTWRLGVIATPGAGSYEVLPIGHGVVPQPNVPKTDADMRPFHAFSVPPVAIPDLKEKGFDDVPWEATLHAAGNESAKRDALVLDASKLAATRIDCSYSLWSPVAEDAKTNSITYYGCFFGSERIEVGDALRIKPLPTDPNLATVETAVMGLRHIFASKDFEGRVYFRGNIYQLAKGDSGNSNPNGTPVAEDNLPVALREEVRWRNQVNAAAQWHWLLLTENIVLEEQAIRGRFYPTHALMPVLNPGAFNAAIAQGELQDQYPHLNNRMDGSSRYIGRKVNRMGSLGASVAHTSQLVLEQFIREDSF